MHRTLVSLFTLVATFGLLVGTASADYTLDLIWADTGTNTLTVSQTAANGSVAGTPCDGANSPGGPGRCLTVQLTAERGFLALLSTVAWNAASSGIGVAHLATRSFGPGMIPPLGPSFPAFRDPADSCAPICDSVIGSFGGVSFSGAAAAGTYAVGSIHLDLAAAQLGQHDILHFFRRGIGGLLDENNEIVPVQVNGGVLNVVPEPGTALLLGAGVLALCVAARRRDEPRT